MPWLGRRGCKTVAVAATDIFPGWTTGRNGDYYVRQLRDAKIGPDVETFDKEMFRLFAKVCGLNLARAQAKSRDSSALSSLLGKGDEFDAVIAGFAMAYANQTERDYAALNKAAVQSGQIEAHSEKNGGNNL